MRKTFVALVMMLAVKTINAQTTIRLEIDSLPKYHPEDADIYLAGSFNGWNPQDNHLKFNKDAKGGHTLDLQLAPGSYEFKLTRGSWDNAETKEGGGSLGNRMLTVTNDTTLHVSVAEWADRFKGKPKPSTASAQVHIVDTAFLIPQLKRVRRVWIYLPEEYGKGSASRYPVLYMHDGQNLFDNATSYSGEWGIDEFLDSTSLARCIVVAIDHGGSKRLNEYNPYNNEKFGKGEGDAYVDFLAKTLKPYIDTHYRTRRDKASTFIAGSSMGGLISMYALLKYPTVFGGAGVFSPAFWIAGKGINDAVKAKGSKVNAKIYFYAGDKEGETMVPDMRAIYETMQNISTSPMTISVREDGKHNEATWRSEFPKFYEWIVGDHPGDSRKK